MATLAQLKKAQLVLNSRITALMNSDFFCGHRLQGLDPRIPINISPNDQGPWVSPIRQTSFLAVKIDGQLQTFFVQKSFNNAIQIFNKRSGRMEDITIVERIDPLRTGTGITPPTRKFAPRASFNLGLLNVLPFDYDSLCPPKRPPGEAAADELSRKYFSLRLFIAERTSDRDLLRKIFTNPFEDEAIRRAAYSNVFFDHNDPSLPGPDVVSQNLDYPESWGAQITVNDDPLSGITYNLYPYFPGMHVLVLPKVPYIHELSQLDKKIFASMLTTARDFILKARTCGEAPFAQQIVHSKMMRAVQPITANQVEGMSLGWSWGSAAVDRSGQAVVRVATQDQLHWQIGTLFAGSYNYFDRIAEICRVFNLMDIDYFSEYLAALRRLNIDFVPANFNGTLVTIPFVQKPMYEVQVFCTKQNFLELDKHDISDLSEAFAYVIKMFNKMGVNSFNMIGYIPRFCEPADLHGRIFFSFWPNFSAVGFAELLNRWVNPSNPHDTSVEMMR